MTDSTQAREAWEPFERVHEAHLKMLAKWGEIADESEQEAHHIITSAHDLIAQLTAELAEARRERDEARRKLEREEIAHEDTVDQRDEAEQAADNLAYLIAPVSEIGEHSFGNSPWENALENYAPQEDRTQLARANAAIKRVVALEAPEEPSVDDENADDLTYDMECDAWAKGYARALETVRRTILEGNGA